MRARVSLSPIAITEHALSSIAAPAYVRPSCAMDAFFSGMDSRLRVAVKEADSIMVGLVNAAMEDAYNKSLWKDGDLERLFQKLRFAELAVMQLDWCLRFVRGEMEAGGADDDDGHEDLLADDLLETRDQIQARLDEAELAVAQADSDYMRRKRDDLDPSRRCRETAPAPSAAARRGAEAEDDGGAFAELRGSVGRKMTRMRARLENASSELAALMQKVSGEASPMARLQDPGHEGDGVKGVSGFYSMAQLLMEFQEMVLDAGVVRDSVASAFDAMERSVSAQREAMEEQRWLVDAEKEMYCAVVEGFLREINVESTKPDHSEGVGCPTPTTLHHSRGATEHSSDEFQSPKDETNQLHSARLIPSESSRIRCYNSEEHHISQEEAERLTERTIDSEIRCELQHVLYSSVFGDLLRKLSVQAYDAEKLTEQRDEMEIRSNLQYEIHSIMFKDLVKNLGVESFDHLIRTSIEDEVHAALLAETMNAWKITTEMVRSERLIKEEIDHIVLVGFINDLVNDQKLSVVKYQHQNRPIDNVGGFGMIDNTKQLEMGSIQVNNVTTEDEGVGSNQHRALVDQEVLGTIDNCDRQNPRRSDKQAEETTRRDDVYDSGNRNFEKGFEDRRKLRTEEVDIGLCMPSDCSEGVNQEMCIPLANIYEIFMDFETIACGKIRTAVLRLRELDKQLSNLIEQVNSLKARELIYRRAFTRRCCDLQTAEAEVDLLGDEVELLLGLLSKTYRALDHYSPVLQYYVGISEMMNLLGKELAVRLSH